MTLASLTVSFSAKLKRANLDPQVLKALLTTLTEELAQAFENSTPIEDLIRGRTQLIDQLLLHVWHQIFDRDEAIALVAVGGYGRGELHPGSDIDLLVLVPEDKLPALEARISHYLTLLWDTGLKVGQSVRSPEICTTEAARELTIATALMESRLLTGSHELFEAMRYALNQDDIWPIETFFNAKLTEQQQRHCKYDDTTHILEPNLKESPGGLRDFQTIVWVAKRHFGVDSLQALVAHGFLTEREYRALIDNRDYLWRIRFALHMLTGRCEDRLLFDLQQKLAAHFNFEDNEASLAVEQFMQRYYRTSTRLQRLNVMLLQLFEESILHANQSNKPIVINHRFQIRNGYIEVRDKQIFSHHPLALLEIFLLMCQNPKIRGIRASTLRLIDEHVHLIDRRFRNDTNARKMFLDILNQPRGVYQALQHMNQYGLLAAYIPPYANIVGRMQYDLLHIYTVDTHTLFLIRNLQHLTLPAKQGEFPLCSEIIAGLKALEVLLLAALFHDIAKGRRGDHSVLGATDALHFCRQHHLSEAKSQLVAWLVRHHLIMSMTAQRKNIEDPRVIKDFAHQVGSVERLQHLYLLTVCDIRATNPERWNDWKDSLLRQLYFATLSLLTDPLAVDNEASSTQTKQREARDLLQNFNPEHITAFWMKLDTDYFQHHRSEEIAWHTSVRLNATQLPQIHIRRSSHHGASEIFIIDSNGDNLFAKCAWILDQCVLNIQQARLATTDTGETIIDFSVLEENGGRIRDRTREEEVKQRLTDGLNSLTELPSYSRHMPRVLRHFETPTLVSFSQDEQGRTLLQLETADRPGLLSRVGIVFTQAGVRLLNALITTTGERAEDTFTIVETNGQAVLSDKRQKEIRTLLLDQLQ